MAWQNLFTGGPESFAMDPDFGSHKDLRSPSIPRKRRREDNVKYYSYRAVHPSRVGQEYYTLNLVSSTVHTFRLKPKTRRHKTPSYHITHIIEKDEPALLRTLIKNRFWDSLSPWRPWISSTIPVATAQALAKAVDIDSYPFVLRDTQTTQYDLDEDLDDDPTNPRAIERIPIDPPAPFPADMPSNLNVKLRVQKWTKRDTFDHKEFFIGGPDRRHHRGKRRVREKHNQFAAEKELDRGTKQKHRNLQNEILGYYTMGGWGVWSWTDHEDYRLELCEVRRHFLGMDETLDMDWDCWAGPEWNWDLIDRSGSNLRGIRGDAWDDEDTLSIGSEIVVLERFVDVNVDVDEDVDTMSDLAEMIVQEEWDMLSRTSSNTSDEFVIVE